MRSIEGSRMVGRRAALLAVFVVGLGVSPGRGQGTPGVASPVKESKPQKLRILTDKLPEGVVGEPYRVRLQASGGQKPYSWSVSNPYLPEGLTLDESTGEIAGTPRYAHLYNFTAHLYDFTIRVRDSSSPAQTTTGYFILKVAERLVLVTGSLPKGVRSFPYRVQLQARGGTPPYTWDVASGVPPPGLELDAASGLLAGQPTAAGDFRFSLRAIDAGEPAQMATGTFRIRVVVPLSVDWKQPPRVEEGGIYGSVQVSNGTRDDLDLTLIVVAVNEYGKAFALGYQHFTLKQDAASPEIPFGFSLPQGEYVVHVDAVAEVAPKNAIYRARRQEGPMRVE
ncbi:MAG: Ig domain-containing protein [Terriglobia bacterium]